jgi:hypothetical protein
MLHHVVHDNSIERVGVDLVRQNVTSAHVEARGDATLHGTLIEVQAYNSPARCYGASKEGSAATPNF